ncbi:MAG TPA: LPS assembly protein LptD [Bryobacteraceae bacterium]|nr:LPS assembly protein LptD [Bryobacteraceae bacterium]
MRIFPRTVPISLSNTIRAGCHEKTPVFSNISAILLTLVFIALLPDFGRAADTAAPPAQPTPQQENEQSTERPDFSVHVARPNAPKTKGDVPWSAECGNATTADCVDQVITDNGVDHLRGKGNGQVVFEFPNATLKADAVDYDEKQGIATATGRVYYRDYIQNEILYASSATYNTNTESGEFKDVRGYMKAKIVARPGLLTSQEPFYFEAVSVDKLPDKYVLHDSFITDCEMPHPWWTMSSKTIDYYPGDHAIAHDAVYHFRGFPVFFFPWFHKSLKTEPRKSGFLTPNIGNSSVRGFMLGLGYYQTIGRSMDVTYVFQDFTKRGSAHNIDFRGRPTSRSDFNLIFYGVQDRGIEQGGTLLKAPGYSITGTGKLEFGNGWVARGSVDYLSSYLFHQQFTDSFTQAVISEAQSMGYLEKHFGSYTFDVSATRTENFLDTTPGNSVEIRSLPESELNTGYQQLTGGAVPLYYTLHADLGLFHRVEPKPQGQPSPYYYSTSQFSARAEFEPSIATAFHFAGFTLLPEATLHERYYSQTLSNYVVSNTNLLRNAPEGKLDLIFPSIARIFNRKTIFGDKLKHVIEPRVRYDYVTGVPDFNDTLLFDPTDLLTDTREMQFGITNRIYAKRGNTVTELFSWDVSGKYYFDPTFGGALIPGQRNVFTSELNLTGFSFLDGVRRTSPIVSTLRASPIVGLSFQWEGDYDPDRRRIVNSSVSANVRFHRYFVTAGSDQIHPNPDIAPPANQFRTTFGYGDNNRKGWNAAFSMVYDYRSSLLEYGIAQVTYNTSCCGFSVQVRRLDFGTVTENQYLASFSIANVASVGTLKKQERIF